MRLVRDVFLMLISFHKNLGVVRNSSRVARNLPMLYQSVKAECGLACIAMIASAHGFRIDVHTLANRTHTAVLGLTLGQIREIARTIGFRTRVVEVTPGLLSRVRVPAIIHWDQNHYVVLKSVGLRKISIHDPSRGIRHLTYKELGDSISGVAVELVPENVDYGDYRQRPDFAELVKIPRFPIAAVGSIILLLAASQLAALALPYFFRIAFDKVLITADISLLYYVFGIFVAIAAADFVFKVVREEVTGRLGTLINIHLSEKFMQKTLSLPLYFFEGRSYSDIASKYESLADIQKACTWDVPRLAVDGLLLFGMLYALTQYDKTLLLLALACVLIYAGIWVFSRKSLNEVWQNSRFKDDLTRAQLLETLQSIQTVKCFNLEQRRGIRWAAHLNDSLLASLKVQRGGAIYTHSREALLAIEGLGSGFLMCLLLMRGTFSMGEAVAFLSYKRIFLASSFGVVDSLPRLHMIRAHFNRIADILVAEEDRLWGGRSEFVFENKISIQFLSHRYPSLDRDTFSDISLDIERGDRVALIGRSGSGKSTFLKVLLKLLPASTGTILIDGVSLDAIAADCWRSQIGTVFQNDRLLSGSIAENIALSKEVDQKRLHEVCEVACVANDINRLPMGYETLIQDDFPLVSAGQKQRILIARALYCHPRIVILDEGTANLDEETELKVLNNIANTGITILHAAHRPQVIASAKTLVYFD